MRLRVHINTRASEIPWDNVFAPGRGTIYSALKRRAPQLGAVIHTQGWGPHKMAPFGHSAPTFSRSLCVRGKYAVGGAGYLEFGSPLPELINALECDLRMIPILDWGGVALNVDNVTRVAAPAFSSGRAKLRTTSPTIVRAEATRDPERELVRGRWLLPGDLGFDVALSHSLRRRCETFGHDGVQLQGITWIGPRRSFSVVGHGSEGSPTVKRGQKSGAPIEVDVSGTPAALQALWSAGIGGATSAGFGWVIA